MWFAMFCSLWAGEEEEDAEVEVEVEGNAGAEAEDAMLRFLASDDMFCFSF